MLTRRQITLGSLACALAPATAHAQTLVAPFKLNEQRILMDVMINGRGPYAFVVDSGATVSVIRPERARDLDLKPSTTMHTDNGRILPTDIAQTLVIGGTVRQANVKLMELPAPNLGGDGLLAAGLLTSGNCELDFDQLQWRAHSPGTAPGPEFTPIPAQFRAAAPDVSRLIYGPVVLDGAAITPVWDTGTPRPLVLNYELAERLGLLEPSVPYAPVSAGGGVDPTRYVARLVRTETLQIGPLSYSSTLVLVRPKGAYGQPAILGLPILRTLNLWIDGPSSRLWVKRSALEPAGGVRYSYAGVWVADPGGAMTVIDVGTGSPAHRAGVQAGDLVEGADMASVNALLNSPVGTPLALNLRRAGRALQVQFVTAAYL